MYQAMLQLIMPEIFVTVMASLILLVDVYSGKRLKMAAYYLSLVALVGATALTVRIDSSIAQPIFSGSYLIDNFACTVKVSLYFLLGLIFIYSKVYIIKRGFLCGEFFALSLFSLLGMMILISSGSFLSMYLGLELFVLPLYAMIVMVKDKAEYIEAAMKYFIIGSLGAGLLLYGISLVYGATGTYDFSSLALLTNANVTLILGMFFVIVSLAIEFGAVPFHMWLPDVYEGSPTPVTMVVGTLPKVAIFAIAYRLLSLAFSNLNPAWQQLFMILAVMSIGLGNVVAIAQTNLKRMLAYSTIGHIGFILLGLFAAPQQGYIATLFYTVVYAFMALAAFAMIIRLSAQGFEADKIEDFRGLNARAPWLAFLMMLIMLSLAGVPPLLGFYAKFLILQTVVDAGFTWLAVLSLLFSVIGVFYYLRVVWLMYFVDAKEPALVVTTEGMSLAGRAIFLLNSSLLLVFGLFPGYMFYLCLSALR